MLKESYIHPYKGLHGYPAHCHIRVYEHSEKLIVVCTEMKDNTGTSVTNMAEYIATDIWYDLGAPPLEHFVWIEHYPEGEGVRTEETFDLTTFTPTRPGFGDPEHQRQYTTVVRDPQWKHLSLAEVEALIGEPWAPLEL